MTDRPDYQVRVIVEQAALQGMLDRLMTFIDSSGVYTALDVKEKERLNRQALHMKKYNDVLVERIEAFGD